MISTWSCIAVILWLLLLPDQKFHLQPFFFIFTQRNATDLPLTSFSASENDFRALLIYSVILVSFFFCSCFPKKLFLFYQPSNSIDLFHQLSVMLIDQDFLVVKQDLQFPWCSELMSKFCVQTDPSWFKEGRRKHLYASVQDQCHGISHISSMRLHDHWYWGAIRKSGMIKAPFLKIHTRKTGFSKVWYFRLTDDCLVFQQVDYELLPLNGDFEHRLMLLVLTLAGCQGQLLYHFPSSAAQGRKRYNDWLMGWNKIQETSFSNYCPRQNRFNLKESV